MDKMFHFLAQYMDISESERNLILSSNRVVKFKKREAIKSMTESMNNAYFVLSGCVYSIYHINEKETVGEFFFF